MLALLFHWIWYNFLMLGKSYSLQKTAQQDHSTISGSLKKYLILSLKFFIYSTVLAKFMILTQFTSPVDGLKMGFIIGICFSSIALSIVIHDNAHQTERFYIDAAFLTLCSCGLGFLIGLGF
jgi:hypothetical protein